MLASAYSVVMVGAGPRFRLPLLLLDSVPLYFVEDSRIRLSLTLREPSLEGDCDKAVDLDSPPPIVLIIVVVSN